MDVDVAYAESVPRYVDLALFLCGETLKHIRAELQQHPAAAATLYAWHFHKVCFLHVLPNDKDAGIEDVAAENDAIVAAPPTGALYTSPSSAAAPPSQIDEEALWGVAPLPSVPSSKEVSFRRAYAQLRCPNGVDALMRANEKPDALATRAESDTFLGEGGGTSQVAGQVHPRSPRETENEWNTDEASSLSALLSATPTDVGFALLCDFLRTASQAGGASLVRRLAAALCSVVVGPKGIAATPDAHLSRVGVLPSSRPITVAQLSDLFDADLLDEEPAAEAGNVTRSFHIWVNYEWASASFARQTQLVVAVKKWVATLCRCCDDNSMQWLLAPRQRLPASMPLSPHSCAAPINVRRMHATLESVFEGHATTRAMLLELSLAQRTPHLADNALAKLLFLQGPPTSALMTQAELSNRGTQPILMCITSGMLLYAQYYLSFRSLAVAQQCTRVALQVAQEVQSNAILALAHYTAHVVATLQGRPADAANSISIALQLTLPNGPSGNSGQSSGPADGPLSPPASVMSGMDAQMASLAFVGAAQLLLFFPGAVGPALRSLLSNGYRSGGGAADDGGAEALRTRGAEGGHSEEPNDLSAKQGGTVAEQTVAHSIRHSLLCAHAALLEAPPVEGRWMGIVASLQRETLLLIGAIYGIVSSPLAITTASLGELLEEVREETLTASPVYSHHPSRMLLWEALRHAAHYALALQEGFLAPVRCTANTTSDSATLSDALQSLRSALTAVNDHYGASALAAANETMFFSLVVRYCSGCQLYRNGYIAAAYDVWSRLAGVLNSGACTDDMEGNDDDDEYPAAHNPANATGAANLSGSMKGVDAACLWTPDHLLLYSAVQRRRAEAAVFLGYIAVPHRLQKELLAVSSEYAFPFGVLTSKLIEAQVLQQNGRFSASLTVARHVERAATRIGYPSLCEAARALEVTAYGNSGCWRGAQRTLARCRPTTAPQRTFVLLQQYAAHLEPLLLSTPGRTEKIECLTRSWIDVLVREGLVAAGAVPDNGDLRVCDTAAGITAVDKLCLYSSLTRACALLGYPIDAIAKRTANCLEMLSARQNIPTPDLCIHGGCEELCEGSLYCG
ncbi:hypothetical protein JKF63_07185 [Porcisia hertigi]|uniref:Uncharacterized protein n=1 Tax=Porcisia hertigi TaxID=2761500 RepID=A0A836LKH5_9TRYP|nr:hypothetical protein JKF63_07185 [Porcisia hertigi]